MRNEVRLLDAAFTFLDKQPDKMQIKILRTISLLEEFGAQLREPHVKKIKGVDDLYELRVRLSNNICRLFFFHYQGRVYVVTSGYVKKENKTSPSEIKKAVAIMNQVKEEGLDA